jgi:HPt (histidine-containing phosphotransfer) domain-containing protein
MTHSNTYTETVGLQYLDAEVRDSLVELMDGEPALLIELIDSLAESNRTLLCDLAEAVAQRTPDAIREAAHALKSSNAQMGALQFSVLCQEMENFGHDKLPEKAREALDPLLKEAEKVAQALVSWRCLYEGEE